MPDVDVAVVGAGPAGLSAAVRARWIKAYRGIPCSVRVFDPAPIGGIGRLGRTRLAGPNTHSIIDRVVEDAELLNIPFERAAVDSVRRAADGWQLFGDGRYLCESRAVILATGVRRLSNEVEYFGRGLAFTYNGYDYLSEHIDRLVSGTVRSAVIIGNVKTKNLLPVFQVLERPEVTLTFLLDETPSEELKARFGASNTFFGRATGFGGQDEVRSVSYRDEKGQEQTLQCERAFIDYTAFHLKPEITVDIEGLSRDERGFYRIGRDGSTNLPGIFAAGDGTGVLFMALKSFAEGSAAGFACYRYVFLQKFGYDPSLINYMPLDHEIDPNNSDYPELLPSDIIEVLGGLDDANRVSAEAVNAFPFSPLEREDPTKVTYGELAKKVGTQGAQDLVFALLDAKLCTIHPMEHETRRPAPRFSLI